MRPAVSRTSLKAEGFLRTELHGPHLMSLPQDTCSLMVLASSGSGLPEHASCLHHQPYLQGLLHEYHANIPAVSGSGLPFHISLAVRISLQSCRVLTKALCCLRGRPSKELLRRKASWKICVDDDGTNGGSMYPSLYANGVVPSNAILRTNSLPPMNVLRQLQQCQPAPAAHHHVPRRTASSLHKAAERQPVPRRKLQPTMATPVKVSQSTRPLHSGSVNEH